MNIIPQFRIQYLAIQNMLTNSKQSIPKQNTYTYWIDSKNKSNSITTEYHPKKLLGPIEQTTNNQGPSVWNSLGSWEQRKILLKELVSIVKGKVQELIRLDRLDDVVLKDIELEGDAYKVFKKSKWNVMYELTGSIKFKRYQQNCQISILEMSSMGDREFEVNGDGQIKQIIQGIVDVVIKIVEDCLKQYQ